jgi:hypothetical protein
MADLDATARFKVDISELKSGITQANQQIKLANSEFRAAGDGSKAWASSLDGLTAKQRQLESVLAAQKQKLATYNEQLKLTEDCYGKDSQEANELRVKINNLTGDINKTESSMRQNAQAAAEMERGHKGAKDAAEGHGKALAALGSAGKAAGEAMVGIGKAVGAGAAALAASTVSAGNYADGILTAATNTHLSTESLQAYAYAAELIDVPLETFEKSLAKNTKSMSAAREGSGAAAEAYSRLGVAVTDGAGNLRDGETVYWETIDALAGIEDETERDALSMQIFGKSAQDLNSLIATGSQGFAEYSAEAQAMGAVMGGEQLAALGAFDDTMQRLTSGAGAAKNALGLVLLPVLEQLGGSGVDLLGDFTSAVIGANGDLSLMGGAVSDFATGAVGAISDALPMVLGLVTDVMAALIQGVGNSLPQIAASLAGAATGLVQAIAEVAPSLMAAGVQAVSALVSGLASALPQLIPAIVAGVMGMVDALVQNLPALLDAGIQLLLGLVTGIMQALPQLIAMVPTIITNLVAALAEMVPMVIEAGVQLLLAIVENLPAIIDGVISAIPAIISALVGFFTGPAVPNIIQAGVQLLLALVQNLPAIIGQIVGRLPEIITAIVGGLVGAVPQLAQAGVQLLQGLIDGLWRMAGSVVNALVNIIKGAIDGFLGFLGIHSPSRVMAGYGVNLGEGLVQGIASMAGEVGGAMAGLVDEAALTAQIGGASLAITARPAQAEGAGAAQAGQAGPSFSIGSLAYTPDSRVAGIVEQLFSEVMRTQRMGVSR